MKSRILSAVILILFLGAVIFFNSSFPMALNIVIALISALAVYELISALGMSRNYVLMAPSILFAAVLPLLGAGYWHQAAYYAYSVVVFVALITYHRSITFREVGVIFSMSILIPTSLETLVGLRELGGAHGMFYVFIAILCAWTSDTGAFFAGSLWGKHKLCPDISPKKTVEGVIGAFVLNTAAMVAFGYVFHALFYSYSVQISYLTLLIIGVVGAALSVLGDLSFSLIKRSCHIKDFSEILPGHGGILDRFDSVIFVAPFVYLLVRYLPIVIS